MLVPGDRIETHMKQYKEPSEGGGGAIGQRRGLLDERQLYSSSGVGSTGVDVGGGAEVAQALFASSASAAASNDGKSAHESFAMSSGRGGGVSVSASNNDSVSEKLKQIHSSFAALRSQTGL